MTAYFQTVATVIPVLLVAGMLNPKLLREYSKTSRMSKYLKFQIGFALCGTFIAACMTAGQGVESLLDGGWIGWLIYTVVLVATSGPLGSTLLFVYYLAKFALDEDPHPKRLEAEKQELERSLALLNRKIDNLGSEEADGAHDANS